MNAKLIPIFDVRSSRFFSALVLSISLTWGSSVSAADVKVKVTAEQAARTGDKATLNALMKHPRVPNFDRLRPMSGLWRRCKAVSLPDAHSQRDDFSSSDSKNFTRTTSFYSDVSCKAVLREMRSSWECEAASNEVISCRLVKNETGSGGKWTDVKTSDDELAGSTIKLTLLAIGKRTGSPGLEVRIKPDGVDDSLAAETVVLDYVEPAQPKTPAKH